MATYGICSGEGPDTIVREADGLREARAMAREALAAGAASVDVVELDGRGPVRNSDGEIVAACHAPKRTLDTMASSANAPVALAWQEQRLAEIAGAAQALAPCPRCGDLACDAGLDGHRASRDFAR